MAKELLRDWLVNFAPAPFKVAEGVVITDVHVCSGGGFHAVVDVEIDGLPCLVTVDLFVANGGRSYYARIFDHGSWTITVLWPSGLDGSVKRHGSLSERMCVCGSIVFGHSDFWDGREFSWGIWEWFSGKHDSYRQKLRSQVEDIPWQHADFSMCRAALMDVLTIALTESGLEDIPCASLADEIACLFPAWRGVDLRKRISISRIEPEISKWLPWASAQDGFDLRKKSVWDFAVSVWKPAIYRTGIHFRDLAEYDEKGAAAFNSFLRARNVRPSEVIDAWESGLEYSFLNGRALREEESMVLGELKLKDTHVTPARPVPRSEQRLGIYRRRRP